MEKNVIKLGRRDAFAVYRLPNESDYHLVRQQSEVVRQFTTALNNEAGFVVHPFEIGKNTPSVLIRADEIHTNPVFSFQSTYHNHTISLDEVNYLSLAEEFIYKTRTTFKKLILSRIQSFDFPTGNLYPLFLALTAAYPNAFVYLAHIPNIGCWMGASPEIFLTKKRNVAKTVALAGTQKDWGINLENVHWGEKEIEEQAMVERYVEEVLQKSDVAYRKYGPQTVRAGKILHLKSTFRFQPEDKFFNLVKDLHPTPAVCGIPKQATKSYIHQAEPHDRAYYCGFLGPHNIEHQTNLFVNLRCMQVFKHQFSLYIGGGITADSDAKKEWQETELKAHTLLDVIERVYEPTFAV